MENTKIEDIKTILSIQHNFDVTEDGEVDEALSLISKLEDKINVVATLEVTREDDEGFEEEFCITINPENKEISLIEAMKLEFALFSNISGDFIEELEEKIGEEKTNNIIKDIEQEIKVLLKNL